MKITSFDIHRIAVDNKTQWVFLELRTVSGVLGLGEPMLGGQEALVTDALAHAAQKLIGLDALEIAVPIDPLADDQATGLLEATVRSAMDQARWDLPARAVDLPVYRLLGPTLRREIPLYANINRGTCDRSAEGFAQRAALALMRSRLHLSTA